MGIAGVEGLKTAVDLVRSRATVGGSDAALVALNDALCALRRQVDACHAEVAAEIARASRVELGNAGLARTQGFRSPVALIAAAAGGSAGDAARLVTVGESVAPRTSLTGEARPAKHPAVAAGLTAGALSVPVAAAIIALLDKVAVKVGAAALEEAETLLVAKAAGLSLLEVEKLLIRALAWLDPDGVEPREDAAHHQRAVRVREDRDGVVHLTAVLDPETAAPVVTVLTAMVGVAFRARQDHPRSGDDRTVPQIQADALAAICRHALGCDRTDTPTAGATVIVRIPLDALETGTGSATIDGITQPVSVETARRMAAGGGVIPCVLGSKGEVLDLGRATRLFTRAQKLALAERDGGVRDVRGTTRDDPDPPPEMVDPRRGAHRPGQRDPALHEMPPPHPRRRVGHHHPRRRQRDRGGVVHPTRPHRPHPHPPPRRPSPLRPHRLTAALRPVVDRGQRDETSYVDPWTVATFDSVAALLRSTTGRAGLYVPTASLGFLSSGSSAGSPVS